MVLTKTAKMTSLHSTHQKNKGFRPQNPENDENDENGGCHSGKTRVYPKNLLRLFFRNNLTRLEITSEVNNNLKRLF